MISKICNRLKQISAKINNRFCLVWLKSAFKLAMQSVKRGGVSALTVPREITWAMKKKGEYEASFAREAISYSRFPG